MTPNVTALDDQRCTSGLGCENIERISAVLIGSDTKNDNVITEKPSNSCFVLTEYSWESAPNWPPHRTSRFGTELLLKRDISWIHKRTIDAQSRRIETR